MKAPAFALPPKTFGGSVLCIIMSLKNPEERPRVSKTVALLDAES